jgi:hypothetical protein
MKRPLSGCIALALAACSPAPLPAPQAAATPGPLPLLTPAPGKLGDLMKSRTWRSEDGKLLQEWFDAEAKRLMMPMTRAQTVDQFAAAGWSCMYGEGSEDYPDPVQVCSLSFATPECQLDWELMTTADKGRTTGVGSLFRRGCIGVERDWPERKTGEMNENIATPPTPAAGPASRAAPP